MLTIKTLDLGMWVPMLWTRCVDGMRTRTDGARARGCPHQTQCLYTQLERPRATDKTTHTHTRESLQRCTCEMQDSHIFCLHENIFFNSANISEADIGSVFLIKLCARFGNHLASIHGGRERHTFEVLLTLL